MLGWLRHVWSPAKPVEGERLFVPPAEVAQRIDSIDEALARDAEVLTPAKRGMLVGLTSLSVIGSVGRSQIFGVPGLDQVEIMKVWAQDSYFAAKGPVKK